MKKAFVVLRLLMGLIFVVFGLNGFFNFIQPPPPTEQGMAFLGALFATGYMFPLIKIIEIVGGVALLTGRFVPLALIVLAPIVVNIGLYHTILDFGSGSVMAYFLVFASLAVAHSYKSSFKAVLNPNAKAD